MSEVRRIEAVAGRGLEGDRYASGLGYWSRIDECQSGLITVGDPITVFDEQPVDGSWLERLRATRRARRR